MILVLGSPIRSTVLSFQDAVSMDSICVRHREQVCSEVRWRSRSLPERSGCQLGRLSKQRSYRQETIKSNKNSIYLCQVVIFLIIFHHVHPIKWLLYVINSSINSYSFYLIFERITKWNRFLKGKKEHNLVMTSNSI